MNRKSWFLRSVSVFFESGEYLLVDVWRPLFLVPSLLMVATKACGILSLPGI